MQPPPAPSEGEPLYEAFYGLREQPFALTTDPRFLYLSDAHRTAFDELLTGLRRREGVLLLTGETGTGKTTLVRAVIDSLGHRTFSALILNPYMSGAEVLRVLLRDFALVSRDEIRGGAFANADVPQLLDTLESFLRSLIPLNSYAVVIIDEAQSLQPRVLDQIRVLGSYEQDGQRLLQIVLVGQPGLLKTIRTEAMRALNERITRRLALGPLQAHEVGPYIEHRLAIAGGRNAVSFQPEAVRAIAEFSHGLPRRVNMLCDRTLEAGRVAGETSLGPDLVARAAKALAGAPPPDEDLDTFTQDAVVEVTASVDTVVEPSPRGWLRWALITIAAMILVFGATMGVTYVSGLVNNVTIPAAPLPPKRDLPLPPALTPPTDADLAVWGF